MSRNTARKLRKILLRTLLAGVLLLVLLFGTSPWWLGWTLQLTLKDTGASIGSYERLGYAAFALREVRYADDASGLEAEIDSVQTATPPAILWKKLTGTALDITVGTVSLRQGTASAPKPDENASTPEGEPPIPAELAGQAFDALDLLDGWPVHFQAQKIVYTSGDMGVTVADPTYATGKFTAIVTSTLTDQQVAVSLERLASRQLRLVTTVSPEPVSVQLDLSLPAADTLDLTGQLRWREQPATFATTWAGPGLLPANAHFEARDWVLPEDILSAEDRRGYAAPRATVLAEWDGETYTFSLDARAAPEQADAGLEPLTAQVLANGDTTSVRLEKVAVEGGWITAQLAEAVTIPFNNLRDLPAARFHLEADLSQQSLIPVQGQITASLVADDRADNPTPLVTARLEARGLAYEEYTADAAHLDAELDWPQLTLRSCALTLPEDSSLTLSGGYDLKHEELSAIQGSLALSGQLARQYAPEAPEFDQLKVDFNIEGPRVRPRHEGDITLTQFAWAEDKLDISLHWRGEHGALEVLSGEGGGDALDFTWEGDADLGLDSQRLRVSKASLRPRDYAELELRQPVTLTRTDDGTVTLSELAIDGSAGGSVRARAQVHWPESGEVSLSAANVSPVWLKLLTDAKLPFPAHLSELKASANWADGPMSYALTVKATGEPENQPPLTLSLDLSGDAETLRLNGLDARQGTSVLAEAKGQLPLSIDPTADHIALLRPGAPADFTLSAQPGTSPLWQWLQEQYQVVLEEPSLSLQLAGSLDAPTGSLRASLARLDTAEDSELPKLPPTENLRVQADFSPDEITLGTLSLDLAGRPLNAQGRLPMSGNAWDALVSEGRPPELKEATGSLRLDTVPLSAFSAYLPDLLRPGGTVDLSAELRPGIDWSGELAVVGVETMPLPQIGSVTGIEARMAVKQTRLEITRASAQIGGQELAVTGTVDVEDMEQPRFDLAIKGEQVPFVRSPGLIVRGSPDLTLRTDESGVTTLGGAVGLDESFFTLDLTALTQGGGGGSVDTPKRSFPYVSIEEEPLASWRLNIDVEGEGFLRVRVPVFEGIVSADMMVRGTMRDPLVLGQATIDQGIVMFPFANLRLQQGTVTIRQDRPDEPMLDITATGRAYGYDLVMRVSGTAEDPQLTFSSTPALEQGDILLMITAGRMPASDQRSAQSRLTGLGVFIGNTILVDLGLVDPLDDQLQVFVGEDVTLTGKDTIRVIYRINDTWAIVGQYDRFDAYTLDFKWTVYED
ncbi:MAG: translocation/assembly module TamB domain-containing protein [Verrucomicrobiota bacterium JB024]|nr:translocation/assembly module TamB domain-containing protein [Verrucomicrobiota bacterium JB024]